MLGNSEKPGLCNLSLEEIFEKVDQKTDTENVVKVSYVEIYNENIRDLLSPKENNKYLDLRDDPLKGVTIAGATEIIVENVDQVMNLLYMGNKRRTTESTNANQTSSRSHAVFQISLVMTPKIKAIKMEKLIGKLSLIDLAGSERGTVTENRGIRLREGAKINRSLLALANCINALGDKKKKGSYVPYRDSKLTRMLKDSLGGNCKTVMIVTISPASSQFEETVNTLKYANRAKNITTKPVENKKLVEFHIAEYKNIISDLRSEIEGLRLRIRTEKETTPDPLCGYCKGGRDEDEKEVENVKNELFQNFQERIQLKRALCELEAQNQLNMMEIKEGQDKLLRYTLSMSGNLVHKNNGQNLFRNVAQAEDDDQALESLPVNLREQMKEIKKIKLSMGKNMDKKQLMTKQMKQSALAAKEIMQSIPQRVKHQDKRDFLEIVVKNHIVKLENDELEYNLRLQEKLNRILVEEIKRLRCICENNGIIVDDSDNEFEEFKPENGEMLPKEYNMNKRIMTKIRRTSNGGKKNSIKTENYAKENRDVSSDSQKKFKKRKNHPSSSPEKYKRFKKRKFQEGSMDKKSGNKKKGSRKGKEGPALVVKNYRMERESRSVKRKKQKKFTKEIKNDIVKMDKEVKNAVDVVNSLQVFGHEINNKSRQRGKGMEGSKKNKSSRNAPRTNYFNMRKN
jgi:kinesin family protein 18/19